MSVASGAERRCLTQGHSGSGRTECHDGNPVRTWGSRNPIQVQRETLIFGPIERGRSINVRISGERGGTLAEREPIAHAGLTERLAARYCLATVFDLSCVSG